MTFLLFLTLLLSSNVTAFSPAIPLAVRSPYLNSWLPLSDNVSALGQLWQWPTTFNTTQILGWTVLIRIDGLTYSLLGEVAPNLVNNSLNTRHLPQEIRVGTTTTLLSLGVWPLQVNLTFLNPLEPQDWVKQSIPFSYMSLTAISLDNASHSVQVYSDISGEWISRDRSRTILWDSTSNEDVVFHSVTLQTPTTYKEIIDQAEWGTLYYAMLAGVNVTHQIASDANCRSNFTRYGGSMDVQDSNLRPIGDDFVFAISRDLGTIQATQDSDPVVWAIGYTTDPVVNYSDLSGVPPTSRRPYYKIQYSNDEELIVDFLNDFSNASSRAQIQDDKISHDAESVTTLFGSTISSAINEVYGSMQLTIGTDAHGKLNESDVMMFMKNIGGSNANRVNAVETLYAAFPALMYIDSSLGRPLLEPLFQLQASHNYTMPFAAADLGSNYPSVSGSNSNHDQGVEQTGNMLIMTYAYARASGDGSLINRYYSLLSSWADYLSGSTLFITNQASADNLTVNNQTNLAIKGIIAIQAMSKMASVVNQTNDVNKYSNAAANLYAQWKNLALSSDQHLLAVYGQTNSWTLGYNLFADVWLGTDLVESSVYNGHSNFIYNLMLNSNFSKFGMPIDNAVPTDTSVAVSSWTMFVTAMTQNLGLQTELILRIYDASEAGLNASWVPPVYYDSSDRTALQGIASPAQGALYAPLALRAPVLAINANRTTETPTPHRKRNIGAIVGGTIAGAGAIFAVIGIVTFVRRKRGRKPRWSRPRSILLADPRIMVTPLGPNVPEATRNSRIMTEQQLLPVINEEPGAETTALRHLSSLPILHPFSRPMTPVPVGLSDKELAQMRAEALPPLSRPVTLSVPVGLSDKELAQMRAEALTSQQPDNPRGSMLDAPRPMSSPTPVAETGGAALPFDRLHSEVESLRREMDQLRAEGSFVTAPPSYNTEGN